MFAISLAFAQVEALREDGHPEPLPAEQGCERFEGTAEGNDPTTRLVVVLCEEDGVLNGRLQWSSLKSGWNVRQLEGRREGDHYALKDAAIEESKPRPGWRFCRVDSYTLDRSGPVLAGRYRSEICDDSAEVSLTLMGTVPEAGDGTPPAVPTPTTPKRSGCACAVSAMAPLSWALWLPVGLRRRS